ncbi:AAA family ATPase [Streptomyces sp. ISL-96]|uniref:ATP-binding protein n=1 Tax=Streptomyces sp. ISL-96 TaxID=2819191 RepID=UPI001BE6B390|nr:AAA family ATPase [Streptomyces sp. ISL-96]MBT2492981.1 AAA family ATPase [Streptomyces sp. ISL-96]
MVSGTEHPVTVPLLERETELAAAAHAVEALCADASAGGVLVFSGEAGLGKTALLSEIRRLAEGRCAVWSARGGETVTSVPFHVVRQLLQPAIALPGAVDTRELLGDGYEIIGPALGVAPPDGRADPQGVRDGLDTLLLRLAAAHRPLVLMVDDAHWSDLETLGWLASFAQRDDLPALVVIAYRTEEPSGDTAEFIRAMEAAARQCVSLRALTPDAVANLARAALGEHADDPFCRELWAVTGGNLYETVELVAKVCDERLDPVEGSAGSLRALGASARGTGLINRLEELGTATTRFAWAAAILGTEISLDLAASLAGLGRAQAADCAERLRAARILAGTDPMEFVHPLIAGAVYRAIPPATRTAMHGQAAWAVTQAGRGAAAAARHLLEVHPDDDPELVAQLREAASEHLAVGAPDAARRCLERAVQEPPLPEEHASVLYELGCATLLTSPATTVGHLRAALGMPGLDAAQRVDAVFRLSQALTHNNQTREAAQVVAAEVARSAPGPDRMRLQAVHFLWEGVQAAEDDGPGRSRRLAAMADGLQGRDNSERVLLILRAFDGTARGENAEEIVQISDRALLDGRLAPGLGWTNTAWGFEPPALLGLTYAFADRLDRAESLFDEALRAFEISGWSGGHLAFAHALVGYLQRRRGRLAQAEMYLRESLRLAERVGNGLPIHWDAACMLIDTLLAQGRIDAAQEAADRHAFAPPYPSSIVIPDAQCVRGRLLLAQGRTKEAVVELEAAGEALTARGRHNGVMAPWASDLARAVAADDPGRAAELAAYVRDRAERFGTDTAIGESLRCAAALEEGGKAVELLAKAVAFLEGSPCAYEHAVARVEYGIAARSERELAKGLALAEQCSADGLVKRAREALRSL